jgi:beta-lactamase regulating signal transducer with metallopeptidase domain
MGYPESAPVPLFWSEVPVDLMVRLVKRAQRVFRWAATLGQRRTNERWQYCNSFVKSQALTPSAQQIDPKCANRVHKSRRASRAVALVEPVAAPAWYREGTLGFVAMARPRDQRLGGSGEPARDRGGT